MLVCLMSRKRCDLESAETLRWQNRPYERVPLFFAIFCDFLRNLQQMCNWHSAIPKRCDFSTIEMFGVLSLFEAVGKNDEFCRGDLVYLFTEAQHESGTDIGVSTPPMFQCACLGANRPRYEPLKFPPSSSFTLFLLLNCACFGKVLPLDNAAANMCSSPTCPLGCRCSSLCRQVSWLCLGSWAIIPVAGRRPQT